MSRLTKMKPLIKNVAVGLGIVGVAGFAYWQYSRQIKIDQIVKLWKPQKIKQQQKIYNQLEKDAIKIEEQLQGTMKSQVTQMFKQSTKENQQSRQNKQSIKHEPHHHDTDIRVLDMVGYPSPHGTHILEPQQKNQQNQLKTQQKTILPQKSEEIKQVPKEVAQTQNQNTKQDIKLDTKQAQVKKVQPIKQQATTLQTIKNKINRSINFKKISQIPQFSPNQQIPSDAFAIIVIDMDYNESFEKQVLKKLQNTLKKRKGDTPLLIYRADPKKSKIKTALKQKYNSQPQQQTILLMKNPYQNKFTNLDFEMYIHYANLPAVYLSKLNIAQTAQQIQNQLTKMTPNQTYILYTVNFEKDSQLAHRKIAAKYIQTQLSVNNMQNLKLLIVDEKVTKQLGIIPPQTRSNTLHLIRRNNQFTYKQANRKLFQDKKPYNVIQNITFYDKNKSIAIPKYLSKLQTFNSITVQSSYAISLIIDRNKINPKEQRQILKVFAKLKAEDAFPNISYIIKFAQTEYRGEKEQPFANKKFVIKLANLDELDKQLQMHDLKTREDLQTMGVQYNKFLKDSYQFLYKQPQVTQEGLKKFITKSLQGQQPQFYKSQAKYKLQTIHKLTSKTFNQVIFNPNSNNSHLVFQYSDHCQTCQILSPLIQHFDDVCKKFPTVGTQVHAINCDKNRVKGQMYSPYTPNLYYYSKKWKNTQPMKYPILQYIGHSNLWGIYDFCTITEELNKIDQKKFDEHIQQYLNANIKMSDF